MILKQEIVNNYNLSVTLCCDVNQNIFTNKVNFDFFALIDDGINTRCVRPEMLNDDQRKMSVHDYINKGRCEFFKHVRPANMFKLIEGVNYDCP